MEFYKKTARYYGICSVVGLIVGTSLFSFPIGLSVGIFTLGIGTYFTMRDYYTIKHSQKTTKEKK